MSSYVNWLLPHTTPHKPLLIPNSEEEKNFTRRVYECVDVFKINIQALVHELQALEKCKYLITKCSILIIDKETGQKR